MVGVMRSRITMILLLIRKRPDAAEEEGGKGEAGG
jgi:hypothetical protein